MCPLVFTNFRFLLLQFINFNNTGIHKFHVMFVTMYKFQQCRVTFTTVAFTNFKNFVDAHGLRKCLRISQEFVMWEFVPAKVIIFSNLLLLFYFIYLLFFYFTCKAARVKAARVRGNMGEQECPQFVVVVRCLPFIKVHVTVG